LLLFALIVFLAHLPFVRLPYYWDEAGQYVPAALDILRGGHWIPHSVVPNIHPPGVMAYLATAWRVAGFHPATTRCAMLLLAAFGALAAFLLAIELSREVKGAPAFLVAALVCASPLFYGQAMLAQLDAPAMLFTALALLWFLQDRIRLSAAACVALVLVKETGIIVPVVFAAWLAHERRWREVPWFAAPAAALAAWIAALAAATGHWTGNPEFAHYNLYASGHPVRLVTAFLRRLYYLCFANLHWIGAAAILHAWRKSRLFQSRSWRIAWLLLAAHVIMLTVLGGAVLERYLLPVVPILYTAMAAGLSLFGRTRQLVCSLALLAGVGAANFVNPPYPFPYENNLAFTDFVKLQADASDYLQHWYPRARVHTVWPLTAELTQPELGFVSRAMGVKPLPNFTAKALESVDWKEVEVLVVFSLTWDPPFSITRFGPLAGFRRRYYGFEPDVTQDEARALVPLPNEAHFERGGQWVDVYVNPTAHRRTTPAEGGVRAGRSVPAGSRAQGLGGPPETALPEVLAQHDQLQIPIIGAARVQGRIQHATAHKSGDELQLVE